MPALYLRQDPAALPPTDQQWTTLKDDGRDGYCRTSNGGKGEYATIDHASASYCEDLCARTLACVAYEHSDRCELHTTVPTGW